jgi:hypothetical protein
MGKKKDQRKISLAPLSMDQALAGAIKVKIPKKKISRERKK